MWDAYGFGWRRAKCEAGRDGSARVRRAFKVPTPTRRVLQKYEVSDVAYDVVLGGVEAATRSAMVAKGSAIRLDCVVRRYRGS